MKPRAPDLFFPARGPMLVRRRAESAALLLGAAACAFLALHAVPTVAFLPVAVLAGLAALACVWTAVERLRTLGRALEQPVLRIDAEGIHSGFEVYGWREIRKVSLSRKGGLAIDLDEPRHWERRLDPLAKPRPLPEKISVGRLTVAPDEVLASVARWSGSDYPTYTERGGEVALRPSRPDVFRELPGRLRRGGRPASPPRGP